MDREQIGLKLAMDILGVEFNDDNYRRVCDLTCLAVKKGIPLSSRRLVLRDGHAYAANNWGIHFDGLPADYEQICHDLQTGFDESGGWELDDTTTQKLIELRQEINEKGLEVLLRNAA